MRHGWGWIHTNCDVGVRFISTIDYRTFVYFFLRVRRTDDQTWPLQNAEYIMTRPTSLLIMTPCPLILVHHDVRWVTNFSVKSKTTKNRKVSVPGTSESDTTKIRLGLASTHDTDRMLLSLVFTSAAFHTNSSPWVPMYLQRLTCGMLSSTFAWAKGYHK